MFCMLYMVYQISILITSIYGINYDGYKLYEAFPVTRYQESVLMKIEKSGYDVWGRSRTNGTKILVPPYLENAFKDMMNETGISIKVLRKNIKSVIDESRKTQRQNMRRFIGTSKNNFDFDRFLRYEEIVNFTHNLVRHSKYAEIINIGNSFEGRPIIGLKIEGSKNNPKIFIDAGIHAREWAAPITALYLMKKIVDHEDTLHKKISIYVIPVVNPDGYEYSHTVDRFWRKTRSRIDGTECVGTDANRNFNSHWAELGVSLDPCSEIFPGLEAFSEPETQAIRDAILAIEPDLYLTFHSYGPMLLYPWGFTKSLPNNWQELDILARIAAHKLKQLNGQDYTIGSSANVLYLASGASDDWAMLEAKVPLVYTMELPDYGEGFITPVEKIKPMVRETYKAFKIFVKYVCALRHINCI